jgi:hypothetical protein
MTQHSKKVNNNNNLNVDGVSDKIILILQCAGKNLST